MTATLSGLTIMGGSAATDGGGIFAAVDSTLTITSSTIAGNSAASGGGIFASLDSTLSITSSTIAGNSAGSFGGGIYTDGNATVNDSTIENNTTQFYDGGGIENDGTLTLAGTIVADNTAGYIGGGIANGGTLAVTSSTISSNTGQWGGGGIVSSDGTLTTVASSSVSDNVAGPYGSGDGGGVFTFGTTTITGSAIDNNSSDGTGGGVLSEVNLTLTNSTVAGNSDGYIAGGIYSYGTLTAVNDTIAGNSVSGGSGSGGGLYFISGGGAATLSNTIVAQNTDSTGADDIAGTVAAGSAYNLIGTGGSGGLTNSDGNQVGVTNPGLGVLANNGGSTQTIALLPGSPAINAGSNDLAVDANGNPLLYDQRGAGFPRFDGGKVDIGAFQSDVVAPTPMTVYVNGAYAGDPMWTPVTSADGSVHVIGYDAFSTIQSGANAVASPGTVNIAPGEYTGPVNITQDLTFAGAGASQATINGGESGSVITVDSGVTAAISGLTITDGLAEASGGGIDNSGTLTVSGCTIVNNSATYDVGGGIDDDFQAVLTVLDSTIADNSAGASGGGISALGNVTVIDSMIEGNTAADGGGGILANSGVMVNVIDSTIAGDTAETGGGIFNEGALDVIDSTIANNTASNAGVGLGGGISNVGTVTITGSTIDQNTATGFGGGVDNQGLATLADSTIAANSASDDGGGIYDIGTISAVNTTIADNSAGDFGGGIDEIGTLTAVNTTIADNNSSSGSGSGGGLDVAGPATATLYNTIVAQNTDSTGADDVGVGAGITSNSSNNLVGVDQTGTVASSINPILVGATNPGLGGLANNGGPTETIALLAGSPAIDAGSNALSVDPTTGLPLTTDQRGALRGGQPDSAQRRLDGRHRRLRSQLVVPGHDDGRLNRHRHVAGGHPLGRCQSHQRQPGQSRQPRHQYDRLRHTDGGSRLRGGHQFLDDRTDFALAAAQRLTHDRRLHPTGLRRVFAGHRAERRRRGPGQRWSGSDRQRRVRAGADDQWIQRRRDRYRVQRQHRSGLLYRHRCHPSTCGRQRCRDRRHGRFQLDRHKRSWAVF